MLSQLELLIPVTHLKFGPSDGLIHFKTNYLKQAAGKC